MEDEELGELLIETMRLSESLVSDYPDYPPIFNSENMLKEIFKHKDDKNYLDTHLVRLNVGLLAAKSLDLYAKDHDFYNYATSLHNTWAGVLGFIGQPFTLPAPGPEKVAYDFYVDHKYDHNRIGGYLKGIDFRCPVNLEMLGKDNIVAQWKAQPLPQGNYYADVSLYIKPSCLGIHDHQADEHGNIYSRIQHEYKLKNETEVLKSTAAAVLDRWSIKNKQFWTNGGCVQYFNSNNKRSFKQVHPKMFRKRGVL